MDSTADRTDDHSWIRMEQLVPEPCADVWTAWTTAPGLATWWWTGWDDTTYEVEARVGGRYRIAAPAVGVAVHGEFERVHAPTAFDATWIWTDDEGTSPVEHVRVELRDQHGSTLVVVTHTGPWTTPEPGDQYREGWVHVLERLATRER